MKIIGVIYEAIADGLGLRTTIFVSGCNHNCKGCQNPSSHDFSTGKELTDELLNEIFDNISKNSLIAGITLSGGDPLDPRNSDGSLKLLSEFKKRFPKKNVWVYTGFTVKQLLKTDYFKKLLPYINYIVDGEFVLEKRDVTLAFRGSTNQRIYLVKKNKNFFTKKIKPYVFIDKSQLLDDLYKDFKIKVHK